MTERIARLGISIDSRDAAKARDDLRGLEQQAGKTERATDRLGAEADKSFGRASGAASKLHAGFLRLAAGVATAGAAFAGLQAGLKAADDFRALENRIRLVTDSAEEFARVQEGLIGISQRTFQSIDGTVQAYQRMAGAVDRLGISQDRLLGVTEIVNKAVALSGASAQAAESSLIQFGQALSNNFQASAQEINSLNEQVFALSDAIARGLTITTGVETFRGDLKRMAEAGQLTSEAVIRALEAVGPEISKTFGDLDRTFGQVAVKLRENGKVLSDALFGPLLEVKIGFWESFAEVLGSKQALEIARAIGEGLVPAIEGVGAALATLAAINFVGWLTSATGAVALLSKAWIGLTAAMAANPIGLLAVGISAAVGFLVAFRDEIARAISPAEDFAQLLKAFSIVFQETALFKELKLILEEVQAAAQFAAYHIGRLFNSSKGGKGDLFADRDVFNQAFGIEDSGRGFGDRINEEIRRQQLRQQLLERAPLFPQMRGFEPGDLMRPRTAEQLAAEGQIAELDRLSAAFQSGERAARVWSKALELAGNDAAKVTNETRILADQIVAAEDRLASSKVGAAVSAQIAELEKLTAAYLESAEAGTIQAKAFELFGQQGDSDGARSAAKRLIDAENAQASAELSASLEVQRKQLAALATEYGKGERAARVYAQALQIAGQNSGVVTEQTLALAEAQIKANETAATLEALGNIREQGEGVDKLRAALGRSARDYEVIQEQIGLIAEGWDEASGSSLEAAKAIVNYRREAERLEQTFRRLQAFDFDPFEQFNNNLADVAIDFFDRFRSEGFDAFDDLGKYFKNVFKRLLNDIIAQNVLRPLLEPLIGALGGIGLGGSGGFSIFTPGIAGPRAGTAATSRDNNNGASFATASALNNIASLGQSLAFLGLASRPGGQAQLVTTLAISAGAGILSSLFARRLFRREVVDQASEPLRDFLDNTQLGNDLGEASARGEAQNSVFGRFSSTVTQLGNIVGSLAGGFLGNQITGRATTEGSIGSAIGGAIGSAIGQSIGQSFQQIGAAFGPIGAVVGATLGNLIGNLFAGPTPDFAAGGGVNFRSFSPENQFARGTQNLQARDQLLDLTSNIARQLTQLTGASLVGPGISIQVGSRDGTRIISQAGGDVTTPVGDSGAAVREIVRQLTASLTGGVSTITNVVRALGEAGSPIEDILAAASGLKNILDDGSQKLSKWGQAIKSVTDIIDPLIEKLKALGKSTAELEAARAEALDRIGDKFEEALRFDIDTFKNPLLGQARQIAEAQAQLFRDAEQLGRGMALVMERNVAEWEAFLQQANLTPEAFSAVAEALRIVEEAAAAAGQNVGVFAESLNRLRETAARSFNENVQRELLQITSPTFAAFTDLLQAQGERLQSARALGADTFALQVLQSRQRQQFFSGLSDEQRAELGDYLGLIEDVGGRLAIVLQALEDHLETFVDRAEETRDATLRAAESFKGYAEALGQTIFNINRQFGRGNPEERLAEMQGEFFRLVNSARGGDEAAFGRLGPLAEQIVGEARDLFGGTAQFATIRDSITGALSSAQGFAQGESDRLFDRADQITTELEALREIRAILADPASNEILQNILDEGRLQNETSRSLVEEIIKLREAQAQADGINLDRLQAAAFARIAALVDGTGQLDIDQIFPLSEQLLAQARQIYGNSPQYQAFQTNVISALDGIRSAFANARPGTIVADLGEALGPLASTLSLINGGVSTLVTEAQAIRALIGQPSNDNVVIDERTFGVLDLIRLYADVTYDVELSQLDELRAIRNVLESDGAAKQDLSKLSLPTSVGPEEVRPSTPAELQIAQLNDLFRELSTALSRRLDIVAQNTAANANETANLRKEMERDRAQRALAGSG